MIECIILEPHHIINETLSPKLTQLHALLQRNRHAQQQLKKIRDTLIERMRALDQYVSTYRLKAQFPPSSYLNSYLRFERSLPASYRRQLKVVEQQQALHSSSDTNEEFIKKLTQEQLSLPKPSNINFLELASDPVKIDFQALAQNSQYKNGLEVYRTWLSLRRPMRIKQPFDAQQRQALIEAHAKYRGCWEKISQQVGSRSYEELYYEFNNHINPKLTKGRWSTWQSLTLIILIEHFGTRGWAKIAERMQTKSELQVRQRFCNILDPSIGKDVWTRDMETELLQVAEQHSYSWKDIAKLPRFRGKTDNSIWRKFRVLLSSESEEDIRAIIKRDGNRRLAEKIITFRRAQEERQRLKDRKKGYIKDSQTSDKKEMDDFFDQSVQFPSLPCIQPSDY